VAEPEVDDLLAALTDWTPMSVVKAWRRRTGATAGTSRGCWTCAAADSSSLPSPTCSPGLSSSHCRGRAESLADPSRGRPQLLDGAAQWRRQGEGVWGATALTGECHPGDDAGMGPRAREPRFSSSSSAEPRMCARFSSATRPSRRPYVPPTPQPKPVQGY
jgi:hypothetical protein